MFLCLLLSIGPFRFRFRLRHSAVGQVVICCLPLFLIWLLTWLSVAFSASSYSKPSFPWEQTATVIFSTYCKLSWWSQQTQHFVSFSTKNNKKKPPSILFFFYIFNPCQLSWIFSVLIIIVNNKMKVRSFVMHFPAVWAPSASFQVVTVT